MYRYYLNFHSRWSRWLRQGHCSNLHISGWGKDTAAIFTVGGWGIDTAAVFTAVRAGGWGKDTAIVFTAVGVGGLAFLLTWHHIHGYCLRMPCRFSSLFCACRADSADDAVCHSVGCGIHSESRCCPPFWIQIYKTHVKQMLSHLRKELQSRHSYHATEGNL